VFDNRIAVSLNGSTQLYTVYDGANPYIDFNGSGQLTQRYLTNPKGLSQFYGQVSASGTTEWFLTDNLNSMRQIISASGTCLDAITYDPFGNIVNQTNASDAPRFLYTGGAVDSLTGNYQFDARPYNAADGRFLTQDWAGLAAGDSNLYRYAFNAPVLLSDPSGLAVGKATPGIAGYWVWTAGTGWLQPVVVMAAAGQSWFNSGWFGGAVEGGLVGFGAGVVGVFAFGFVVALSDGAALVITPGLLLAGGALGSVGAAVVGSQTGAGEPDFLGGAAAAANNPTVAGTGFIGGFAVAGGGKRPPPIE
jgi:RHS repeat-associated protein